MTLTKTHKFGAFAVLLATAAWFALPRGTPVEVAVVSPGELRQTVVMSGRISTPQRNDISAQNTARIEAITVREGDAVQAGQILVKLRDDEAQAAMAQAKAAAEEARAALRKQQSTLTTVTEQQLDQAKALDHQAKLELQRAQDLMSQGFVSQSRVDDAHRAARSAAAAMLSAMAQAEANRTGGTDSAMAQSRLSQALAAENAARSRLEQLVLRAPMSGKVLQRHADPGDTAQPGKVLITLAGGPEIWVVANADEKNLALLKVGQSAMVSTDAFPAQTFPARLDYLAPAVDPQRGTVEVRLTVQPVPDFLRTDMTASVEIVTARRSQALLMPSDALRQDGQGPYVLLIRDGRAVRQAVKTGISGVGTVEIIEGLSSGDRVVLPGGNVTEGATIREQSQRSPKANVPNMPGFTS